MQIAKSEQTPKSLNEDFNITCADKKYKVDLQYGERIRISIIMDEFSQYKWSEEYSIDQLQQISKFFRICDNLEEAFQSFSKILKSQDFTISINQDKMKISFSLQKYQDFQFDIYLTQGEVNISDVIMSLTKEVVDLKVQVQKFNQILEDKDKQIEELKELISKQKVTQNESLEKRLEELEDIVKPKPKPKIKFENILYEYDVEQICQWINKGAKKINLQLLYQATRDGFELASIYEKCAKKIPVIIVVKTTLDKRFGAFMDRELRNYDNYWVNSNPNNCFLFSLDLNKKLSSNYHPCQNTFYSNANHFKFGFGPDLQIWTNSNTNNNSKNICGHYGRNEGVTENGLLAGEEQFTTTEIEVFQVIYQ